MKGKLFFMFLFILMISCSSDDENCKPVFDLRVVNNFIDETRAGVIWDNTGTPMSYTVEYGTTGFTQGTGFTSLVPFLSGNPFFDNTFVARGLETDTAYDFYVRVNCQDGSFSEFIGPVTVTTLPFGAGCTRPTNVMANDVTGTTINLSWEGHNETLWYVMWTEAGGDFTVSTLVNQPFYLIDDLLPDTAYVIEVLTVCSDSFFEFSDDSFDEPLQITTAN